WLILMAISDLDKDDGIPVNVVSKLLHVDPSFVTTQSKLLEKKGLLRRRPSPTDARVVRLSLAEKTQKHIASLNEQYRTIREFVFQEFDENELTEFTTKLATLKNRLEKACVRLTLDF
ncbi:MAG: MarR family transcriptional regulator, partial [Bradyrhizobium sp.]|nr:MarR family transcriptional regulator [Bradyrhizobium sp.]